MDVDVFANLTDRRSYTPQLRIYLQCDQFPPFEELCRAMLPYEPTSQPRKSGAPCELSFVRRISFDSVSEFRIECDRVAKLIGCVFAGTVVMSCLFDTAYGETRYVVELRKERQSSGFAEVPPGHPAAGSDKV